MYRGQGVHTCAGEDDGEGELRARRATLVDGHARRLGRGLGRGEREPLAVVRGDEDTLLQPVSGLMPAVLCTGCATGCSQSRSGNPRARGHTWGGSGGRARRTGA